MFKNVLVGVDGRSSGRDATALAQRLADAGASVTLAHVRDGQLHQSHPTAAGMLEQERAASQTMLEQERVTAGIDAQVISIGAANPGRGLHEQAERQRADLLIVGSCSRALVGRAMLGDDTRRALNGAPCTVAVASAGYAEHSAPLAEIGVAYNGSPESRAALALARELAEPGGTPVLALEVVALPAIAYAGMIPPAIGNSIEVMIEEANDRLRALTGVRAEAVYGLVGEELAQFGDRVDILAVGSRGYGPLRRLVLGSTSQYLERHARCSLLVLPRAAVNAGPAPAGSSSTPAETTAAAIA